MNNSSYESIAAIKAAITSATPLVNETVNQILISERIESITGMCIFGLLILLSLLLLFFSYAIYDEFIRNLTRAMVLGVGVIFLLGFGDSMASYLKTKYVPNVVVLDHFRSN